jgi:nucleotide-binding universal stress UspA family protein
MLELRRILCPVDFSDASRHALDHALVIARWYGSDITALHVSTPVFLPQPPILFAEFPKTVLPTEADRQELEAQLRDWLAPARAAGLRTDVVFEEGRNPAAHILERAGSLPADLIVLGTHGRGGFERLLIGSVAEKVLRKASCPVMTVPPPALATSKLPFKRLLCPVDFSEPSLAALRFAFSIAKESDARLTIMHVFDWPPDDELLVERTFDVPEYRHQLEGVASRRLDALISGDERNWCQPTTKLSYGKPYRQILATAENEEADLIVMGVHGRNALDLMLFGSTTNHVVRRASCPVLTLRQ